MHFQKLIFIFLFIISCNTFALTSGEVIKNNHLYPSMGIGISEIECYKTTPKYGKSLVEKKIYIQPIEKKPILITTPLKATVNVPALGNPTWIITPQQLPVTEDQCLMVDADECNERKNDLYSGGCYQPCLSYGPKVLAFDEKKGKLYLIIASTQTGASGLGFYFTFIADIHKKTIQFFATELGPLSGDLSPNGKYLVLTGYAGFKIYDTDTKKSFQFISKDIDGRTPEETQLHYLTNLKWISNTKFTYNDEIAHDKFQDSVDGVTEYTLDIISQKSTPTRIIQPYEFKKES